MLAINLNELFEKDVVCRLFPYTFEGEVGSWYFSPPARSIGNLDTFKEQFLKKFGDERTTTTLVNDLSNIKATPNKKIKDFNSRFNKLLNKIPATCRPSVDVQIEWYISALPSNIVTFLGRAQKIVLVDNMKEDIVV